MLAVATGCDRREAADTGEHAFVDRQVRYRVEARNRSGRPIAAARIRLLAPARVASQELIAMEVSHPHAVREDALGNRVIEVDLDLPPYGSSSISVLAELRLSAKAPAEGLDEDRERWLVEEPSIEVQAPEIQRAATEIQAEDGALPRAIHEFARGHIEDVGYLREEKGALRALRERRGDCTEYMHLFVALARARGVPARALAGWVVERDEILRARTYHNWAQFHDGARWRLADPQRGIFGEREETYVAMRVLGVADGAPLRSAQRFATAHPDIELSLD